MKAAFTIVLFVALVNLVSTPLALVVSVIGFCIQTFGKLDHQVCRANSDLTKQTAADSFVIPKWPKRCEDGPARVYSYTVAIHDKKCDCVSCFRSFTLSGTSSIGLQYTRDPVTSCSVRTRHALLARKYGGSAVSSSTS